MPTKKELLDTIATTIADYRVGEIERPDVERWIAQFPDKATHLPMLEELDHLLRVTYLSRATVEGALKNLCTSEAIVGKAPAAFWKTVTVLRLQGEGKSQADLLSALDKALMDRVSTRLPTTGAGAAFLYVDDAIFTGRNLLRELKAWIEGSAPPAATLTVVVLAAHQGGAWYAEKELNKAAAASGKKVQINFFSAVRYEDRKRYVDTSEVFRPVAAGGDPLVDAYVKELADKNWPPVWRASGAMPASGVFKSATGRDVLEWELLKAGCRILEGCPNRKANWRPLGFHSLATLGFGAALVTYRNCPNNAPLALWWGDPDAEDGPLAWYPLVPRRQAAGVDTSTFFARLFEQAEARRAAAGGQAAAVSRSPLRGVPVEPDEAELMPWEDEARQALQHAVDGLTFDVEEGVVQADDDYGPTTFGSLDALTAHLEEIYDELWYANVPFDSGEAVFDSDSGDQVTEALGVFQDELERLGWW